MTTSNQTFDVQAPVQAAPTAFRPEVLHYVFPQTLVDRLSREQRWSAEYTGRVLTEYRRFVNLAASGTGSVTPSQTVDEAWHLHLTFTRDYWEGLTPLLPGALHHEPADGSADDAEKYRQQYLDTLDRYAALYGERPPLDIWPDPRVPRPAPARLSGWSLPRILIGLLAAAVMANLLWQLSPMVGSFIGLMTFAAVQSSQFTVAMGGADGDGGDSASDGGSDGGGSDGGGSCGGGCGGGCGS